MTANMSLFIPHVFPNFTSEYIIEVFEKNRIGIVDRVDFVSKQDKSGKLYNAVFVHFKMWYKSKDAEKLQSNIANNLSTEFYHDKNWYWILLPNNTKKFVSGDRKQTIDIGDEKAINMKSVDKESVSEEFAELSKEWNTMQAEMDEIEAELEKEDAHLVSVDWRYIKSIEDENKFLRAEMLKMKQDYEKMMKQEVKL